jgi:hypothetical protein
MHIPELKDSIMGFFASKSKCPRRRYRTARRHAVQPLNGIEALEPRAMLDANGFGELAEFLAPLAADAGISQPVQSNAVVQAYTTVESEPNDTWENADLLTWPLPEDPAGSGLFGTRGIGTINQADYDNYWSDPDYWTFEALAGDVVSIRVDAIDQGVDPYVELRTAGNSWVAADDNDGPGNNAFISHYVAETGKYLVRVGKGRYSTTTGDYELHIDVTRGIQMESDSEYANDSVNTANYLVLASAGAGAGDAAVAGVVMKGRNTGDVDLFSLGTLSAGNQIELNSVLPSNSTLIPWIGMLDAAGNYVADQDGDPTDARFEATIAADGEYFALITSAGTVHDGKLYVPTPEAMTFSEAISFADSIGGHLVTIDSESENEWLRSVLYSEVGAFWIGLSDADRDGFWTWTDGSASAYTAWAGNEPNSGYTSAYFNSNGLWYDRNDGSPLRGVVEVPLLPGEYDEVMGAGPAARYVLTTRVLDTLSPRVSSVSGLPLSGETTASVIRSFGLSFSEDLDAATVGGFDLREAGADGLFDTADDAVYQVTVSPSYGQGTEVSLIIEDGPLGNGYYRLQAPATVTDRLGNPLDGNGDTVGGDSFEHLFTVSLAAGYTFEGRDNNALENATALTLSEDLPGLWLGRGIGSIEPADRYNNSWTDPDWWSFEAEAGDRISIRMDTPESSLDSFLYLYGPDQGYRGNDDNDGPGNDAYLSNYVAPESGTYYIRAGKDDDWQGTGGSYRLHVDVARGIELESDSNHQNDQISGANPLSLNLQTPGTLQASTAALLTTGSYSPDTDLFSWGTVSAGNTIQLSVRLPSDSTLMPRVRILDSLGQAVVDEDGDPSDGNFLATLAADGEYFAEVTSGGWTYDGTLYVAAPAYLNFAEAEAYAAALGGSLLTIDSAEENEWVRTVVSPELGTVWLGLSDREVESQWVWLDGSESTFTNWHPNEPNRSSNDFAYISTNGLWYDASEGSAFRTVVELSGGTLPDGLRPGHDARYVLDVTIKDAVAPRGVELVGLPEAGGSTDAVVRQFGIRFSEDLDPFNVNDAGRQVWRFGDHYYALTDASVSWHDAEAEATAAGGNLVRIDNSAEQAWIQATFGAYGSLWTGLTDAAIEGDWQWSSGEPVTFTDWADGEPTTSSSQIYDYAYIHTSSGWWYDDTGGSSLRGLIELDASMVDTDGDGRPDVWDPLPTETYNIFDLREAGADGVFDTADDEVKTLRVDPLYFSGTTVQLSVEDGPLAEGRYRFTANHLLQDRVGLHLDGNGDGTPGDAFQQEFEVRYPDGFTFEDATNEVQAAAVPLTLIEDPAGGGLFIGRGIGSVDPSISRNRWLDQDWWSFEAHAGDRIAVRMDARDGSPLDAYFELRSSDGGWLAADEDSGPYNNGYVSDFHIAESGTYFVHVGKDYYSGASGEYELRVDVARNIDLESDAEYNNDSIAGADLITLQQVDNHRAGSIAGVLMAPQSGNLDEDYYDLGDVQAGESVLLSVRLPEGSVLRPVVEIRDTDGALVSLAPNPSAAVARADITVSGRYFAKVVAVSDADATSRYLLDVALWPTSQLDFADLVIGAVTAPAFAASGETITVTWEVGNYGTSSTLDVSWFDSVFLSRDDVFGNADDIPLGSLVRVGPLAANDVYQAQLDVQLPRNIEGDYRLFVESDVTNTVFEYFFEQNNIAGSDGLLSISRTPTADLSVGAVANPTLSVVGESITVDWTVTNFGLGETGDGTPGGAVNSWLDRIVLSRNAAFGDGDDIVLADVARSEKLGTLQSYAGSWTGALPSGLSGTYYVLIRTDVGNAVYEPDEGYLNTAVGAEPIVVAPAPYADLEVTSVSAPAIAVVGEAITVNWTVQNTDAAWSETPAAFWRDRVVLSANDIYGDSDDINLGVVSRQGGLNIGDSYAAELTANLPGGLDGSVYVLVAAD